jgi:hypothetical protein
VPNARALGARPPPSLAPLTCAPQLDNFHAGADSLRTNVTKALECPLTSPPHILARKREEELRSCCASSTTSCRRVVRFKMTQQQVGQRWEGGCSRERAEQQSHHRVWYLFDLAGSQRARKYSAGQCGVWDRLVLWVSYQRGRRPQICADEELTQPIQHFGTRVLDDCACIGLRVGLRVGSGKRGANSEFGPRGFRSHVHEAIMTNRTAPMARPMTADFVDLTRRGKERRCVGNSYAK